MSLGYRTRSQYLPLQHCFEHATNKLKQRKEIINIVVTFYAAELSMYTNDSLIQNQPETDEKSTRDFWVGDQYNQADITNKKQYEYKKTRNEI